MDDEIKLKKNYQQLLEWNTYRLKQNNESLVRLVKLLSKLDRSQSGEEGYEKDIVDLDSLKIIYETSIRNFESQIKKYQDLIDGRR